MKIRRSLIILLLFGLAACNNPEAELSRGNLAYRKGDFRSAEAHYQLALQHDKTKVVAHFNLGKVAFQNKKPQEALEHFRAALPIEIKQPIVRVYIYRCLMMLGQKEEAKEEIERALKVHSDLVEARVESAKFYFDAGDYARAAEDALAYSSHPSYREEGGLMRAAALEKQGLLNEAILELESLLKARSYRIETHLQLARLLVEVQDYREAERRLKTAIGLAPSNLALLRLLARVFALQKKYEYARAAYGDILKHPGLSSEQKAEVDAELKALP